MNMGIIGCGLIGAKRANHTGDHKVLWVADVVEGKAQALADKISGARVARTVDELLAKKEIDAVIVATTHDVLVPITQAALQAGKHVLVEKPAARNAEELQSLVSIASTQKRIVRVGFNHRFHPALHKAHEMVQAGHVGPMMFIRARYGHGGRLGYEKEWRANPAISGGGEAVDQGVHLVDLSRWFLGDLQPQASYAPTYFWDMPVEDNVFMLLRTSAGQAAWLHASWTEWKNMFSFEIYGRTGKLQIDGLGGSYGVERLTYYKMGPQLGPPDIQQWEFQGPDVSWALEFQDFLRAIDGKSSNVATLGDALAVLQIIDECKKVK